MLLEMARLWPDFRQGSETLTALTDEAQRAIALADQAVQRAETHLAQGRPDAAAEQFGAALRHVADHTAARDGLLRCPPSPPAGLQARTWPDRVTLTWRASPSAGEVRYRVLRKSGSPPISATDGDAVAQAMEAVA